MNLSDLYEIYLQYPKVVTDSRNLSSNSIFFALKGANFNGNSFAQTALDLGAAFAIVDEDLNISDDRIIKVDKVLESLQSLANYHRRQLTIPVIGITGTNGKTTTKELLGSVLSQKYKVLATKGNFNNHIGVPLTLLEITKEHEIAIIEMGANHKGEIYDLCKIAEPNYGLVTNVGMAHLEGFGSFENIIETKSDLYRFVQQNKGVNFMLKENELLLEVLPDLDFVEYSIKDRQVPYFAQTKGDDVYLNLSLEKLNNENLDAFEIQTNLVGDYNLSNVLAAITVGDYFKIDIESTKKALELYQPNNNRSQIQKSARNSLILDAYNANPTSVMGALQNFIKLKEHNKTIILGDMFELGTYALEKHQAIVDYLIDKKDVKVILVGASYFKTKSEVTSIQKFENISALKDSGVLDAISQSFVLLKGSRAMGLEQLIGAL